MLTTPGESMMYPAYSQFYVYINGCLTHPVHSEFTGYLTDASINGQIAKQQNAVTIVLEHRFYGASTPYGNLKESSLKYHTIQQAIDDLEYFANNVVLPFPGGGSVKPRTQAPWILVGGSYSGALVSWTMVK